MIKITLQIRRRTEEVRYSNILIPTSSIFISLMITSIILLISNINPIYLYEALFSAIADYSTLKYSIPLILTGVGLAIAYKANIWNIGGEGQILAGALMTTLLALYIIPKSTSPFLAIMILYIFGFFAGGTLGFIAGFLKAKFNVNEVLSTLMLNYVMIYAVNYLVYGPWKGVKEYGYPRSDVFPENMWIPQIPQTSIHYPTLILAIAGGIATYVLIYRSKLGYEIRVVGGNPEAAKYSGINIGKITVLVMFISGGFAGIAGVGEVAGVHRQLIRAEGLSAGFGYTAILVAWLAKLNPLIAIVSGYFIGALVSSSYTLQIITGVSYGSINIITGLLLATLISSDFLSRYKPIIKITR